MERLEEYRHEMDQSVKGRDNEEALNVMVSVGKCVGYQTKEMNGKQNGAW